MADAIYCLECDITAPTRIENDTDMVCWYCARCGRLLDTMQQDWDYEYEPEEDGGDGQ